MGTEIKLYDAQKDYLSLLELIQSEGEDWEDYLKESYQINLRQSITYVVYADNKLIGYVRSINDPNYFIWVIDLLVHKAFRGHSLGSKLLERVKVDYANQEIFIMSDVDGYYKKLGFPKEGSIFKMV